MVKEERKKKVKDCNGMRKRITKILRKSLQGGDFQQKVKSTMHLNPRLNVGRLLSSLMCPASHCS